MIDKSTGNSRPRFEAGTDRSLRPGVKWGAAATGLLCLAGLLWHLRQHPPGSSSAVTAAGTVRENTEKAVSNRGRLAARPDSSASTSQAPGPIAPDMSPGPNSTAATAASTSGSVDPDIARLVAGLKQISGTNLALSAEMAALWRTNFTQLVQSGPAAVPALRAFLDEKVDYPFSHDGWQASGYSSARMAAIDALRQIGGAEATAAMGALLSTTQSPRETALLARNLEEGSPGQYREQALAAARAGLQAAIASPDPQRDVAPLFEVFQHYGDASVIPDLEQAIAQWKYYATMALANLPDSAGVPSLLRLAEVGSGSRLIALEMVAQLASDNTAAREFLLTQVSANKIGPNLWPYLTGPLSGDQYYPVESAITPYPQLQSLSDLKTTHLVNGNQNFYTLPGDQSLTPGGLQQRLALVEELLRTASDPAVVQALQAARETLAQRSSRGVAQTPGPRATGP